MGDKSAWKGLEKRSLGVERGRWHVSGCSTIDDIVVFLRVEA
jgi:hypothetical protein